MKRPRRRPSQPVSLLLALIVSTLATLTVNAHAADAGRDTTPLDAGPNAAREPTDTVALRVGVAGSAPFVLPGDTPRGLSVDIWQAVARRAGREYTLEQESSVAEALERVEAGELDVAVGPISVTAERSEKVGFTQPYFHSSLAILAGAESSVWARLAPFLTKAFFGALAVLMLVLVIVGMLLWLAERKKNTEQFPADPLRGISNGVWLALVTMTTVGYGDRAPVTLAGRVIAGVWMVVALITATSLTAGVASAITLAQSEPTTIERAADLRDRRVAVIRGTTGAALARSNGAKLVAADTLENAMDQVLAGQAVAVVFDRPQLEYALSQRSDVDLSLAASTYRPQGYAFAVDPKSTLSHSLTVSLLEASEAGEVAAIVERWLGAQE